jgi:hypothetical protein
MMNFNSDNKKIKVAVQYDYNSLGGAALINTEGSNYTPPKDQPNTHLHGEPRRLTFISETPAVDRTPRSQD